MHLHADIPVYITIHGVYYSRWGGGGWHAHAPHGEHGCVWQPLPPHGYLPLLPPPLDNATEGWVGGCGGVLSPGEMAADTWKIAHDGVMRQQAQLHSLRFV